MDYGDAIRTLAEQHRIDLSDFESRRQASPEYRSEKEKAKRMTKLAQEYFVSQFDTSAGARTLEYLRQERWLSEQLIKQLWLGYTPSQSQKFFSYFQKFWFSLDDLMSIGLAKQGTNEIYAFFRDRLIIPIRDQLGNIIGFWARALREWQEPKYLNSPETIIYDKSSVLYGIDHLKQGVRNHKAIIVVEGYFDVIALLAAGLEIGVATCGTALTDAHMKTLQRYSDNIYFLFDSDNAGQIATLRALEVAYNQGVYPQIINLMQDQKDLESSKDIDDFVRNTENPEKEVQDLVKSAQDGFQWAIDYFTKNMSLTSPVERQKILYWLFDLVYATKTMSTQNLFLEQIAEIVWSDYALILSQYRRYIRTEKRVFRTRLQQEKNKEQEHQVRKNEKALLLGALLYHDFWKTNNIDKEWMQNLKTFLEFIQYDLDSFEPEEYQEWQLRRENELADIDDSEEKLSHIKTIILPRLHTLQQDALKHIDNTKKAELLNLLGKLR